MYIARGSIAKYIDCIKKLENLTDEVKEIWNEKFADDHDEEIFEAHATYEDMILNLMNRTILSDLAEGNTLELADSQIGDELLETLLKSKANSADIGKE